MYVDIDILLILIVGYIEVVASQERLCADAEVLGKRFPQLSDCVLTWLKRIPDNIEEYCVSSKDLQDFCSRREKYKTEISDSHCSAFRSNIDHWVECMAYLNFQEKKVCHSNLKCSKISLYNAIPDCNQKTDLTDYQSCIESGSQSSIDIFRNEYFGVPTYMIILIVVLAVVLIVLIVVYKTGRKKKKKKSEKEVESMESVARAKSTASKLSLQSTKSSRI